LSLLVSFDVASRIALATSINAVSTLVS